MEQEEPVLLISKLRDMDITKRFEDKISSFEHQLKTSDDKTRELLNDEFNRLAKEIEDEIELQKREF